MKESFDPNNAQSRERTSRWKSHHEVREMSPPSRVLVESLQYTQERGTAIDVGAGPLQDTRYLLGEGFEVTAIDSDVLTQEYAEKIDSKKLHVVITNFDQFDFPKEEYDVVSATASLPFNSPETFDAVLEKIKGSLKEGGIFSGQLFGANDTWSDDSRMKFHTHQEAEELFADMEVLKMNEREFDGQTVGGEKKHWHIIDFIVRKRP